MSEVKVNKVSPRTGTDIELGDSGDTVSVTGNIVKTNAVQGSDGGNIISQSGTTNTIGATGDVIKTAAGTTKLEVQGDGSSVEGKIQLNCHANSHGVILQSPPHSSGQSWTIKLPDNQIAADKFIKIKSITGSGATAVGQAEFADAGGGAMDLLHTATGSNVSSIDINGYFTSSYDHYKLIYSVYGATNNTDTFVRIMQGGSVVSSSNYWYAGMGMYRASGDTSANQAGSNGASYWRISSDDNTNNAQYPTTGEMLLSNPLSTTHNITMTTTNIGYNSASTPSAIRVWTYAGQYVDTGASSGISFAYDGGNINGTIRLYGMKNS